MIRWGISIDAVAAVAAIIVKGLLLLLMVIDLPCNTDMHRVPPTCFL